MNEPGRVPRTLPSVPLEPLRERDPRMLGPFRLLGRLGAGGMGVAYLSETDGDWSVVKMVRPELAEDRSHRARIARELEAMRRAAGPHTASLLEEHLNEDPAWFAMEFIPGTTLTRHVEENGAVPAEKVKDLAADLAHVLEDIHLAGVIHRDLKPSNIMLSPTGPRIIDFGIADIAEATQLTRTGSVMGSTGWLAPEQITGDDVTASTDVHAWGLCVLFAATGHAPFDGGTASSSLYRVLESTPDVPESLGEPLRALVEGALNKSAARRPTVDQIVMALDPPPPPPPTDPPPPLPEPAPTPATLVVDPAEQWTEEDANTTIPPGPISTPKGPAPASTLPPRRRTGRIVGLSAGAVLVAGALVAAIFAASSNGDATNTAGVSAPNSTEQPSDSGEPLDGTGGSASAGSEPSDGTSSGDVGAVNSDSEPLASDPESPVDATSPVYGLWVDHEDPIPDQIVKNSLDWQVDLCSPDADMAKEGTAKKISLYKKVDGEWEKQSAAAQVEPGDRCGKDQVHIVMDVTEPAPKASRVGEGWSKCTNYRVALPETENYAKTNVDMCVRKRADEAVQDT